MYERFRLVYEILDFITTLKLNIDPKIEMARSRMRRSRNKRRRQRGGATAGWQPDGALSAQAPYAMVNKAYDGCMAASRPGQMAFSMGAGLPGMRGGAYSVNPGSSLAPGVAEVSRDASHCMRGGRSRRHSRRHRRSRRHGRSRKQRGGVGALAAYRSDILTDGRAGYSQSAGATLTSVGSPLLLNNSYNPVMMSKACSQTGGRHRKGHKSRKSRKSRRSRR